MKTIMKKLVRDEKGAALILALILLLIGGLISAALLGHMGSGILAGEVHERRTAELYAADAGVEDAIWKIQHQVDVPSGGCNDTSRSYNISDVNGKSVHITIDYQDGGTYRITSIAVTDDGGGTAAIVSGTQIEAYITAVHEDYTGILNQVITSKSEYILLGPTTTVPQEGEEHGPVANYTGIWPTADDLSGWYWQDVKDEDPYDSGTLDVQDYTAAGIGPLSRNGTLNILNTGDAGLTLSLNGTVYITGDTLIGTQQQAFNLNLNGNTIFVESATMDGQYALKIGTKCTITGSGCIIAVGDINFLPNLNCSPDDYVLVMSIEGKTWMHPNGDFYGTLAGSAEVEIQNGDATWTDPSTVEGGLNFPGFVEPKQLVYSIASWEISQL